MPETPQNRDAAGAIRRTFAEGTRRLPTRARDLPSFAVRTAITGVGKAIEITERARSEFGEARRRGVAPTLERLREEGTRFVRPSPSGGTQPSPVPGPDEDTGVRTRHREAPEDVTAPAESAPAPAPAETPQPPAPAEAAQPPAPAGQAEPPAHMEPAQRPAPAEPADTASTGVEPGSMVPTSDELPVVNYDELSLGSLRGRLRNFSVPDLGKLLAYERAHQNRDNVVRMFENRILKLQREH